VIHVAINISFDVFCINIILCPKMCDVGGADVTTKQFQRQPVTTDTRTEHLPCAVHSVACALLSDVITDVPLGSK